MATETFTWKPNSGISAAIKHRVLSAEFGDGYTQTASDGLNAKSGSWPLTFTGSKSRIDEIQQFLDRQAGWKSFHWSEPFGALILVRASDGYTTKDLGGSVYSLSVTFKQSYQP